jgi:hypothetical protein
LRLGRSVEELLRSVSGAELLEWEAFNALDPVGDWRHDLSAGVIAANYINTKLKEGAQPFTPFDFMPLRKLETTPSKSEDAKEASEALSNQVRVALWNAAGPFKKRGA